MKKALNIIITVLLIAMGIVFYMDNQIPNFRRWGAFCLFLSSLHIFWTARRKETDPFKGEYMAERERAPHKTLTELVLLNEKDERLTSWNIYGKNGLVIGRDIGENQVEINLEQTTYASMIDIEHAILNFSGSDWYVEDISVKNGISIQKTDGRKYKLAYGKPCKLVRGDIIYIALTRLQII